MSYDFEVLAAVAPELPGHLPGSGWVRSGDTWAVGGNAWQIVVGAPQPLEPEDVPEEASRIVAGLAWRVEINVEPISAPATAIARAERAANAIAKAAQGVVMDPQTGSIKTPGGVKRFRPRARAERFSILDITWWFTDGPLGTHDGIRAFVEELERVLPEAMPKRYGLWEPPPHRLAEEGRDHFITFLAGNREIVWYPSARPVLGVTLYADDAWGMTKQLGWRCNYLRIRVEQSAIDQPGWNTQLDRAWRALTPLVRPFYGDARTIPGYVRRGATYGSDDETGIEPVRAWFWRGIPRHTGHAFVLGEPYASLWPLPVEQTGGYLFLSKPLWDGGEDVALSVGGVPEDLAQPWTPDQRGKTVNWCTSYAAVWPFGDRPDKRPIAPR